MKTLFCKIYGLWLAKLVATQSDPLVVALDALFGGPATCRYCAITRALMFGAGLPLLWFAPLLGSALIVVAVALTLGERYWLCSLPEKRE